MSDGEFEATIIHGEGDKRKYYKGMISFADTARRVHVLWTAELIMGREASCDICLPDKRVSRKHGIVSLTYDGARFSDLASSNGSARNGERVEGTIFLNDGDRLDIGGAFNMGVKVRELDEMPQSVLIAMDADEYLLTQTEVLIGRDPSRVDVAVNDPQMEDVHAQIEFVFDTPIITSLIEDKLLIVDGKPTKSTRLREYSNIRIGSTRMTWKL